MALKTLLVSLGGASSSGKTTVAKLLHQITPNSILLHQDDFYKPDDQIPVDKATGLQNWDIPDAINFESFLKELQYIKDHGDLSPDSKEYKNRYNSDTKDQDMDISPELISEISTSIAEIVKTKGLKIIFVDGFMLYHDPEVFKYFDWKVFLTAKYKTLKDRREARHGYQTQETFWVDPPGFFDKIVYPAYAETHGYLFNEDNVDKDVKLVFQKEFNVFQNDNVTLDDVFRWSARVFSEYLEEA